MGVDQSSIYNMWMYLYLHRKEKDGEVEVKGLITICNLLRSTWNKGRGRMDTYL